MDLERLEKHKSNQHRTFKTTTMQNTQKETTDPQLTPPPVTVTLDEAKKMDRELNMNDRLILTECVKKEKK